MSEPGTSSSTANAIIRSLGKAQAEYQYHSSQDEQRRINGWGGFVAKAHSLI